MLNKNKPNCVYSIYNQLKEIGVDKQAAKDTVSNYQEDIGRIACFTHTLSRRPKRIVSTLVLLEVMLTKCRRPHYSLYHRRNQLSKYLHTCLHRDNNRQKVLDCYSSAMTNLIGSASANGYQIPNQHANK
jgi:hypothetical protein